jgi:predicted dehydrogenase
MTRVAFVGTGGRSVSHLVALTHIPGVEIVGLADIKEEICYAAQERANAQRAANSKPIETAVFTDFRRMVESLDPDCLYLCVPPFVHAEIDHPAIELGKPIFFEKPIAVELAIAKEIAAHLRQRNLFNAVGYQKRFSPAVERAVELLKGAQIGMAMTIRLSGLPGTPWWRVQSKSGGMLIEQHTHAVDMLRVLCGEIESVYAVANTLLLTDVPNLDIFDVNACTVRLANGAPGIIANSCAAPEGSDLFPGHLVHVVTRDMMLSVATSKTTIRRSGAEPEEIPGSSDMDDTYRLNLDFIEAVRSGGRQKVRCDYEDALRTFAVTYACQHSAETNKVIEIKDLL